MSQIVQKLVAQAFTLMGTRYKTGNIEKLDRYGSPPSYAGAIIWLTSSRDTETSTGAVYLKVANCPLWVDGREAAVRLIWIPLHSLTQGLTGSFLTGPVSHGVRLNRRDPLAYFRTGIGQAIIPGSGLGVPVHRVLLTCSTSLTCLTTACRRDLSRDPSASILNYCTAIYVVECLVAISRHKVSSRTVQ